MEFEAVIGLEVHAQLSTRTKMFCSDSAEYTAEPNKHVCPVCLGMPGTLPVVNKKAVEYAIMAALALNCKINTHSVFARKNYFYPDLPKGYQISQFNEPLAENGFVDLGNNYGIIDLERIHMEEDAGKSIHDECGNTLIDYNRSGVPLIEIVSKPQIKSAEEASLYLKKLHQTLLYLGICHGSMEKGNFRCDANISVRPVGVKELGVKVELKNINSFRFVKKGIEYEIKRQINKLKNNQPIQMQTRLYNSQTSETYPIRNKETSQDYRYFPEPDLLPLTLDPLWIKAIMHNMPELPDQKRERFCREYNLSSKDVPIICANFRMADYFEKTVHNGAHPRTTAKWLLAQVSGYLNAHSQTIAEFSISAERFAELLKLVDNKNLTRAIAEKVFFRMIESGLSAADIINQNPEFQQTVSEADLHSVVAKVCENNKQLADKYREGKTKVFGALMGLCMQETKGQANPETLRDLLKNYLELDPKPSDKSDSKN